MTVLDDSIHTAPKTSHRYVLTLQCPARGGVMHTIGSLLHSHGCAVLDHRQFDDAHGGMFFLRSEFLTAGDTDIAEIEDALARLVDELNGTWSLSDDRPARVVVMVSKLGHCLNDLIFRWRSGTLGGELVAVVSNHDDLRPMAEAVGLPYHRITVTPSTKTEAEDALLELIDDYRADLVVLARYMQVLSDATCSRLRGRAINIHHSFLPGFKGAKPYHQAFERGVKYVGATAHYVTPDLDEGPIIEQEVIRIDHTHDPRRLATTGSDAEALALSRAVRWHCQHRVLLNGTSTVVFD